MNRYEFNYEGNEFGYGHVYADSEEEAEKKIKAEQWDDIYQRGYKINKITKIKKVKGDKDENSQR